MSETPKRSPGLVAGLVVFALLAICIAAGAWWYFSRAGTDGSGQDNTVAGANSAIPALGSRGRSVPDLPDNEPDGNSGETDSGADAGEDPEPEPEPEYQNTAREIDIWLYNLGVATKAGDRKGMAIDHDLLKAARPHTLVDDRVRFALENETSAIVRIQFMFAFHDHAATYAWAQHVYDTRTGKFLGTDMLYSAGEVEELKLIATELFNAMVASWQKEEAPDQRLMSLLRNALDTEKPDWMLDEVRQSVLNPMLGIPLSDFAGALKQEFRNLLLRRTVKPGLREVFFLAFFLTFESSSLALEELERAEWWDYAAALAQVYGARKHGGHSGMEFPLFEELRANADLPKLFERLLQGTMDAEAKRLLIQRIAEYDVPNGRAMIENGLATKDANYPDYLIAFGSFANSEADLQRLTSAADDSDVAIAQGGIEGLRQSGLQAADTELRKVLEQGANPGVKSQALGALLSRANDKSALLEEYLDVNKDASLRAVAVAGIPDSNVQRLQQVVEEDPSLRVRQAALNRLGALRPDNVADRKNLRAWFLSIKERDESMVIRSAARKFAEALND